MNMPIQNKQGQLILNLAESVRNATKEIQTNELDSGNEQLLKSIYTLQEDMFQITFDKRAISIMLGINNSSSDTLITKFANIIRRIAENNPISDQYVKNKDKQSYIILVNTINEAYNSNPQMIELLTNIKKIFGIQQ